MSDSPNTVEIKDRIPDEPPSDRKEWSLWHFKTAIERIEKVIAERGIDERDCASPIWVRVDNIIRDFCEADISYERDSECLIC